MHYEVLVEDPSGKCALDIFMRKIVGGDDTYRVIPYRGIGHVPHDLQGSADPSKRLLLNQLPRLIGAHVEPGRNGSPSFQYFRRQVRALAQ